MKEESEARLNQRQADHYLAKTVAIYASVLGTGVGSFVAMLILFFSDK